MVLGQLPGLRSRQDPSPRLRRRPAPPRALQAADALRRASREIRRAGERSPAFFHDRARKKPTRLLVGSLKRSFQNEPMIAEGRDAVVRKYAALRSILLHRVTMLCSVDRRGQKRTDGLAPIGSADVPKVIVGKFGRSKRAREDVPSPDVSIQSKCHVHVTTPRPVRRSLPPAPETCYRRHLASADAWMFR